MRHPIQLPNYIGCLMEFYTSLKLFYTTMNFKILKFANRPSVFFPSNLLYIADAVPFIDEVVYPKMNFVLFGLWINKVREWFIHVLYQSPNSTTFKNAPDIER
jgi:hypothetical protein